MRPVRGQMKIGEEDLPGPQQLALRQLRLLHLHDEIGGREDVGRSRRDARTSRLVVRIIEPDAGSRTALDENLMSRIDEFAHPGRHQADSILMNLDLFGDSDFHEMAPSRLGSHERTLARHVGILQKVVLPGPFMAESAVKWRLSAIKC